jgi:hypothetical protein
VEAAIHIGAKRQCKRAHSFARRVRGGGKRRCGHAPRTAAAASSATCHIAEIGPA